MTRINIEGMDCGHCAESVKKALSLVNGIDKIEIDLNGKCAYVEGNFSLLDAAKAVNNAGYEVV